MSRLQKMSIQGIRSFGSDDSDKQVITFFSPLTLILGPNGTGKTTIIECLKYMTTGEMPPGGRKDGAFIHDPKVARESEVKAKIVLQFNDVKGSLVNAHRNLVGTQKLKRVEMKTVDSLITRWNANGEKVSISNKCAEMDREMVSLLGVSKAVLDNVIFCHQEEANWPLSEGKALKQKFDDIFASTRYVKALESIKKCRQAQSQVISQCVTEIKYLKQNKEKAAQIKGDLQEKEVQYIASKESIEQIQQQLLPLEEKLDMLQNRSREVIQLQTEIEKLKSERVQMEKTQLELRDAIEHEFTGSTSALQQHLKDFKNEYSEQQRSLKEDEAQLTKVEDKMDALGQEKSYQLLDLGKMEQDSERHKQQTKKRDDLIRSFAQEYNFEGFEGRLGVEHVKKLVSQLGEQAKACLEEATATKMRFENQESELQQRIDDERNKKTALETSKAMKNNTLKQNTVEARSLKQELSEAVVSAQKLDDIVRDIRTTEEDLKDTEDSVDIDALRSKVSTQQKQKEELDVTRKRLDAEMNRMSLESSVRTQLSVYRKDKTSKEELIRRLKAKNEESLQHLLGDVSGGSLLRTLDDYIGRQSMIVRDTSTQLKDLTKRFTQVETDHKNQKDFLNQKEEEYRGYEQKIFNVCESQNFDEGLKKVSTKMKQSQDTLGYLKGTEHVYKKYKSQLQRADPPCPLCHRPFDSGDEVDELITELDSKLNLVPAKLERVDSECDKFKSKYETMLQLKPVREAVSRLFQMADLTETELPRLKAKVKALSEEAQRLNTDISQLEERCEVEEMDSSTATSLQPDIKVIDRYETEVRDLDKKITMQAAKLSTGGDSERSMQHVTSERETVNTSLDLVNSTLERTRDKLSNHSERVQQLKSTLNELMSERLTIERDLQQRTQLEERKAELESSSHELTNDIREADRQLQPLAKRIAELTRQKEQLASTKEKQVDKEKAKHAKVNECKSDITSRQEEIKRYEREGKQEMLAKCREKLQELEEKAEQLSSTRDQVFSKITATRKKLDTQKTRERELEDNMQLRRRQIELEGTTKKMGKLEEQLGGLDVGNLEQERRSHLNQHNRLQEKKSHAEGRLHGLRDQIQQFKRDLEGDYKEAEKKYMDKKIDLRTTELAQRDLDKYYKALDRAVMSYHKTKMAEINKIIRELWKNTYRGNDIETIEIRSDEEDSSGSTRRVYNYRVVMIKSADTVLDMRGRCSAGQKVLSSLLIRLALAETFCLNCGILALDEPTTNLDRENIESLAQALVQIIKFRSRQCNFQLVVITHDEDFVELLGRSDFVEYFYKVSKNTKGCSQLAKARVEDL